MNRHCLALACVCWGVAACGPVTDLSLPGVDNTLAGNGNLQVGGRFSGTGTLSASQCESACAPTLSESLLLTGSHGALRVRVGATGYPAVFDGNTVSWRATINNATCDGSGTQVGVVTLSETGGSGTRVNTSVTHCNQVTQSCSCSYAMSYVRIN